VGDKDSTTSFTRVISFFAPPAGRFGLVYEFPSSKNIELENVVNFYF
jgi:hypothetical protein